MTIVSLKAKLLLSMILACTLIVLVVSIIELYRFTELERARIDEEFSNFQKGAQQTIREAVWRYDWDMVKTVLESQTSQVISFVEICDHKVSKCLQHGTRDNSPYVELQTPLLYGEGGTGKPVEIGTISLQSHYEPFWIHAVNELPRLLVANILGVFGVALVLFFLFHRQAVQRLLILEHFTSKIDLQKITGEDFPIDRRTEKWRDEIDLLGDAIRGLIEKTRKELERRQTLEKQLHQAQKMEALGNLAGGIAHDFNNILAAILGFAELSQLKCEPGTEMHQNLAKIISAGQRARNLTSQILVFSRRTESLQEILVFSEIIDEALTLVRASLPANICIETFLDPGIRVRGDSNRLHQVVMNVAANGAQAMGDRGGNLKIGLTAVDFDRQQAERYALPAGSYCCLAISDAGPGIPEEIQSRVFEPFFTTKKAGKGTGMGLAVVHGIIQSHGGVIHVDSRPGMGTTFFIYLPRTEEHAERTVSLGEAPHGHGRRVVLVDDETQVLDMGAAILKRLGYSVTPFHEPKAALAYVRTAEPVELVITDLTMPEMNGVELAASIKADLPKLPVMLWTGYKEDIASESLESGLVDYILQKPFNIQELAQAVHQVFADSVSGPG